MQFRLKDPRGRRSVVYLAYLDDSGTHVQSPIVLCGCIVLKDERFYQLESTARFIADYLMVPHIDTFKEFHAYDLFSGAGIFKAIDKDRRFTAISYLLEAFKKFDAP